MAESPHIGGTAPPVRGAPPPPADATARALGTRAGVLSASKFLGRLAQLDLATLGKAVDAWRHAVTSATDAWFEAEGAVAQGVLRSHRHREQEVLLGHMTDLFRRAAWFKREAPGARIHSSEAGAQYVATLAMLALLVRDQLREQDFELLYRPFAQVIPTAELERE